MDTKSTISQILLLPILAAAALAQPSTPTLYVAGDSTAHNNDDRGWGDQLATYFDTARLGVVNRALPGRSSRTFLTEGHWDALREELKPGDFVIIEFGHNDGGPIDKDRARGSLPGVGDDTRDVTLPTGKSETVRTFGWYLRKFVADARAKGATPILSSPTVRNIWQGTNVERSMGEFAKWTAAIAKAEDVLFLDHTNAIADQYEKLGPAKVAEFFPQDHTHTSVAAADLNASLIVACLKGVHSPLADDLSEKGKAVEAYPAPLSADRSRLHLPVPANPNLPTLFLIGDSTVRNGHGDGAGGQWGWGEPLVGLFDTSKINVVNRAVGGLSSRTYLTQGDWAAVVAILKPGDFVMMQFGHNDSSPLDDAARARGTIPGAGDETKEIDNPITHQHEVVHSYGWYLRKFVEEARAKGATPIVCSLIPRKIWKDGHVVRSADSYAGWARQVAETEHAPFVDLNEIIARRYDAMGQEKVEPMFADPHTHTSRAGAELNAEAVVEGLKALPEDPLAGYLK